MGLGLGWDTGGHWGLSWRVSVGLRLAWGAGGYWALSQREYVGRSGVWGGILGLELLGFRGVWLWGGILGDTGT